MDIYSLAATHIHTGAQRGSMSARVEDRYYSQPTGLPRLSQHLLGSMAVMAGVILFLGTVLI